MSTLRKPPITRKVRGVPRSTVAREMREQQKAAEEKEAKRKRKTATAKPAPKPKGPPPTTPDMLCDNGKRYYNEYKQVYYTHDQGNMDILLAQLANTQVRLDVAEIDWQGERSKSEPDTKLMDIFLRRINDLENAKARLHTAIQKRMGTVRRDVYVGSKHEQLVTSQRPDTEDNLWQGGPTGAKPH